MRMLNSMSNLNPFKFYCGKEGDSIGVKAHARYGFSGNDRSTGKISETATSQISGKNRGDIDGPALAG